MPLRLFNIVCNDHGRTQRSDFSVLDLKYPSRANLVQNIKTVSLSCNLVPRLFRMCKMQW